MSFLPQLWKFNPPQKLHRRCSTLQSPSFFCAPRSPSGSEQPANSSRTCTPPEPEKDQRPTLPTTSSSSLFWQTNSDVFAKTARQTFSFSNCNSDKQLFSAVHHCFMLFLCDCCCCLFACFVVVHVLSFENQVSPELNTKSWFWFWFWLCLNKIAV